MDEHKQSLLQQLRDSPVAKVVDAAIEATDQFLGPSGKAWMANGLDELRQAVALGTEQVQAGNNPGLWGTITTGEATIDRTGKLSLDEMRGMAQANSQEPPEHDKGIER
jgi:hypothetical protein